MKIEKFTIAGGNPTLLIWDCPAEKRKEAVSQNLGEVEQVGFIDLENGVPKLTMMGGELCLNASLASASQLGPAGSIRTSGLSSSLEYLNVNGQTTLNLQLPYQFDKNIVLLPGIGFLVSNSSPSFSKLEARKLACKYNLPAFGQISIKGRQIEPYIYVKATDSLIKETACGSGSIAASLTLNRTDIIQPTGQVIRVERDGGTFHISAQVKSTF